MAPAPTPVQSQLPVGRVVTAGAVVSPPYASQPSMWSYSQSALLPRQDSGLSARHDSIATSGPSCCMVRTSEDGRAPVRVWLSCMRLQVV